MERKQADLFRLYGKEPYRAVVLHGGPGAPGCAAGLCRGLAEKVGAVEHLQRAQETDALCGEIAWLIDAYCGGSAVVIGHSFGAWLALLFAERYPERTEKAVLIGCGPLNAEYLPQLIETRRVRREKGLADTDNFCALPDSSGDMLYFDGEQHMSLMKEMSALRESGELRRIARSVECPVLAIHGEYDPHPAEGVWEPMKGIKSFRMLMLKECGHDPWKEKYAREKFFEVIGKALEDQ